MPTVRSINASGHKYGLVYPGVGWVVWRSEEDLPNELIFHVNYLGGDQPTFSLNFSKGAGQILAQYYNFLRLGRDGYTEIMQGLEEHGVLPNQGRGGSGPFRDPEPTGHLAARLLADWRTGRATGAAALHRLRHSAHLRQRGWIVPAYTLAPNAQDIAVLRVVVRESFSRDIAGHARGRPEAHCGAPRVPRARHLGTSHARPGRSGVAAAARARPRPKGDKTTRGVC